MNKFDQLKRQYIKQIEQGDVQAAMETLMEIGQLNAGETLEGLNARINAWDKGDLPKEDQPMNLDCLTEKKPNVRITNNVITDLLIDLNTAVDVNDFINGCM